MCGIAGIVASTLSVEELNVPLQRMMEAQRHRGPDGAGVEVFSEARAAIGCQRLSLVDLDHGMQPVGNEDHSVYVVFNGEIYNHGSLREQLKKRGHRFRSRCDTEVIVHLYEDHGDECLEMLDGMFGLAIFDLRLRRLLLARDRCGMKPVYFAQRPEGFFFASEIKALLASGRVIAQPDLKAIDTFLSIGWVPPPRTGFEGVEKLAPGSFLVVDRSGVRRDSFWRFRFRPVARVVDDNEYATELERLLRSAVATHLAADVPVGCFVSGGWDSSLIATYAAEHSSRRLQTFSIVFPDNPDADESRYSRMLASHLQTEHHEIEFRDSEIPTLLPKVVRNLEEPMATAPATLVHQLALLAGARVKTVLSGEGSDELFAGYPWLFDERPYYLRQLFPRGLARLLAGRVTSSRWKKLFCIIAAEDEPMADAEWFRLLTPEDKHRLLGPRLRVGGTDLRPAIPDTDILASCKDRLERRLCLEFTGRLPEGLLMQGDKLGMAQSLEFRMPFLDRAVVRFAEGLSSRMKARRGREKYILSFLARRLPSEIANRRKQGLAYPGQQLLQRTLFPFVRELLLDSAEPDGPINRAYVEQSWPRWTSRRRPPLRQMNMLVLLQLWWNEFFAHS